MNEQTNTAIILSPPMLLERAIQSGVTPEVLEKLMGLQERWQAQQAKTAFNSAMADMRANLPPIVKNQKVDFSTGRGRTSYQYEDLNDVTEVLTPHLAQFGLAFRWRTQPGDPVTVTCIVSHRDGHQEESGLSAPRDESGNKNAIQGLGSSITYLQRYTLKAALGVAACPDDDGRASDHKTETLVSKPTVLPPKVATEQTRQWMLGNLQQFNGDDLKAFFGCAPADIPLSRVPTSREWLGELVREIELFIKARTPQELPLTEDFWNATITVPRAGTKRVDYLQQPDTIQSLYDAAKAGDEKARTRLFGLAREWQPQEWTGSDGAVRPPSQADMDCRKALDAFLEYEDAKGEK